MVSTLAPHERIYKRGLRRPRADPYWSLHLVPEPSLALAEAVLRSSLNIGTFHTVSTLFKVNPRLGPGPMLAQTSPTSTEASDA